MAQFVCLGVHIVDILGRPVERIPEGQRSHFLDEIRVTVAGTAAATAVDLAKLGARVAVMGAIGQDDLGDFLLTKMAGFGIDTARLVRRPDVQTSATMLPIRPNGERPALHVVGANATFGIDDVDWTAVTAADYLHLGGMLRLLKLDGEPAASVLRFARDHGVTTSVDVLGVNRPDSLAAMLPSLPYIDYFMPNLAEAQHICGLTTPTEIARYFRDQGVGCVALKMGGDGSLISWDEGEVMLPALEAPVVDSTGCGDAYCAGFLIARSLGWDIERSGRLATAAAALVIGGLGSDAGIIDFPHTIDFMQAAEFSGPSSTGR